MEKRFKEDKCQYKIAPQIYNQLFLCVHKEIHLPNLFYTRKRIFWNCSVFKWSDYQNADFPFNFQLGHRM